MCCSNGELLRLAVKRWRFLWTPTVARVYGVRPWEMDELMMSELAAMADDLKKIGKEQRGRH